MTLVTASPQSVRFFWSVTDHFRREPGKWRMEFTEWTVQRPWRATRPLMLFVDLGAGVDHASGRFVMAAQVGVKGGRSAAFSLAAAAELSALAERLRKRRFDVRPPTAYFPLSASKKVPPRAFTSEREFLSTLASADAGDSAGRRPQSLDEFLDSFRAGAAGDWGPHLAAWEYRKPIHIAGRSAAAILKLHIAPADLSGRVLGAASSVTIWPPWSGTGAYPPWLRESRGLIRKQFRAAGHDVKWYRGPNERGVMLASLRERLKGVAEVVHQRRVLESMLIGDEP